MFTSYQMHDIKIEGGHLDFEVTAILEEENGHVVKVNAYSVTEEISETTMVFDAAGKFLHLTTVEEDCIITREDFERFQKAMQQCRSRVQKFL